MPYKRKTRDYWDIQGNYGQGWEVVTAADTWKEARQYLKEYRENEPGIAFRARKKRERIEESEVSNAAA